MSYAITEFDIAVGIEPVSISLFGENVKKKQHTTIYFDSIEYNVGLTDKIFTERYLKSPPRKYIK